MTAHEVLTTVREAMGRSYERADSILRRYDTDRSGAVNVFEFRKIAEKAGIQYDEAVDAAFNALDRSKDGSISYEELDAFLHQRETTLPRTPPPAPHAAPTPASVRNVLPLLEEKLAALKCKIDTDA